MQHTPDVLEPLGVQPAKGPATPIMRYGKEQGDGRDRLKLVAGRPDVERVSD